MAAKKKSLKGDKKGEWESVKIKRTIVDLVRENKRKTHVPVGDFFSDAALEKLKRDSK